MKQILNPTPFLAAAITICLVPAGLRAEGPLAAKVTVTTLQSYSGSSPLPKPTKILVYDFAIDASNIQVDESQKIRPRHMITGDENPETIAKKASANFAGKLSAALEKSGILVERASSDVVAPDNTLSIQGAFTSLRQGDKAERVGIGMGAGGAAVQTKVDIHLKTLADAVLFSQFQTETSPAKNMGSEAVVAGANPAAVAAKSTVGDRRKNLDAYVTKTADAIAEEIMKQMATQGWVKLDDKGEAVK